MARGAGAGLSVLLGCEALLLIAAVATVLPAVRDGIEGAEGRIVERIASWREAVEPMIASAIARATGSAEDEDVPGVVPEVAELPPEPEPPIVAQVQVQAPREPMPAPVAEASREPPVTTASVPREPPRAPVIALAPIEADPPPLREFAPPPQPLPPPPAAAPPVAAPPPPAPAERATLPEHAAREQTTTPSAAPPPPPPVRRSVLEVIQRPAPGEIAALQRRLIELGLLRGEADDIAGDMTMDALERYLDRHRFGPGTQVEALTAHMDRMLGGRAPSMPTEVFLIGRDFAPELRAELTRVDLQTARSAITHALSALGRGESYAALARRGGASFVVTPVSGDRYDRCRRFTLTIHTPAREQTGRGIRACRIGPSWHLSDG